MHDGSDAGRQFLAGGWNCGCEGSTRPPKRGRSHLRGPGGSLRLSVWDGLGILTLVLLKGCPLRCPWCANPKRIESGSDVLLFSHLCASCVRCVPACTAIVHVTPLRAGSAKRHLRSRKDSHGRGRCVEACPHGHLADRPAGHDPWEIRTVVRWSRRSAARWAEV